MRYAYAVAQPESWSAVFESGQGLIENITHYLAWLQTLGPVEEPRGIVFHDLDAATTIFSTNVLPAWTDDALVHLDPLVSDWKQIYLSALTSGMPSLLQQLVRGYYESLDRADVATIVAHELTHHLQAFAQVPEEAMWFEEGFCFYAPRQQLLEPSRRAQLQRVEKALIDTHTARLGGHPIWQFGRSDTGAGFTDALFDYWRAIRTVSHLIDTCARGNIQSILTLFITWNNRSDPTLRLHEFLIDALNIAEVDQRELHLLPGNAP
jgi:hypothetical protein